MNARPKSRLWSRISDKTIANVFGERSENSEKSGLVQIAVDETFMAHDLLRSGRFNLKHECPWELSC